MIIRTPMKNGKIKIRSSYADDYKAVTSSMAETDWRGLRREKNPYLDELSLQIAIQRLILAKYAAREVSNWVNDLPNDTDFSKFKLDYGPMVEYKEEDEENSL